MSCYTDKYGCEKCSVITGIKRYWQNRWGDNDESCIGETSGVHSCGEKITLVGVDLDCDDEFVISAVDDHPKVAMEFEAALAALAVHKSKVEEFLKASPGIPREKLMAMSPEAFEAFKRGDKRASAIKQMRIRRQVWPQGKSLGFKCPECGLSRRLEGYQQCSAANVRLYYPPVKHQHYTHLNKESSAPLCSCQPESYYVALGSFPDRRSA